MTDIFSCSVMRAIISETRSSMGSTELHHVCLAKAGLRQPVGGEGGGGGGGGGGRGVPEQDTL